MLDIIEKIFLYISAILLVIVIVVIGGQVASRYFFSHTPVWSEELARYCSIAVTMFGAAIAVRTSDHITVDVLGTTVLKDAPKPIKATLFVVQELACFIFYALIVWSTVVIIPATRNQIAPGMGISMTIPYLSLGIGGTVSILFLCEKFCKYFKAMK